MANTSLLGSYGDNSGAGLMFRNRIIGGCFRIWQRGTSLTGVTPSLGVSAYTADRWFVAQLTSQSATDVSQQTTGATKYAIRVQKRSGGTGASTNILGQVIENLNCFDLVNQAPTLTFTARAGADYSPTSSVLIVRISTSTSADQAGLSSAFVNGTATGQATLIVQNITLTTTNQKFTINAPQIASNVTNVCVTFAAVTSAAAAGANDWFEVSDVQLEAGPTATPFERRPIGMELALCQRYYYRLYSGSNFGPFTFGIAKSTTQATTIFNLPVSMRVIPTSVETSAANTFQVSDGVTPTVVSTAPVLISSQSTTNMMVLDFTVASGLTQFRPYRAEAANNTNSYIGVSAEL